ncbi:hypothetical protein N9B21_02215 [Verrucomicrobiales bacterium]|nr:hypothetical protein [Verrucomicrobiales bacterium]
MRRSKSKVGRNTDEEAQTLAPIDTITFAAVSIEPAAAPAETIEQRPAAAMPETKKVALPAITDAADRARASAGFQAQGSPRQVFPRPMTSPSAEELERQRKAANETKAVVLSR